NHTPNSAVLYLSTRAFSKRGDVLAGRWSRLLAEKQSQREIVTICCKLKSSKRKSCRKPSPALISFTRSAMLRMAKYTLVLQYPRSTLDGAGILQPPERGCPHRSIEQFANTVMIAS